jgi:hypothetical protein
MLIKSKITINERKWAKILYFLSTLRNLTENEMQDLIHKQKNKFKDAIDIKICQMGKDFHAIVLINNLLFGINLSNMLQYSKNI